jgi:hypothetical protein
MPSQPSRYGSGRRNAADVAFQGVVVPRHAGVVEEHQQLLSMTPQPVVDALAIRLD